MTIINIHEAKTHFSKLINDVQNGKEVIIAKAGKPVARVTVYEVQTSLRQGGQLKGLIDIPDDFDAPLPEDVLTGFYGEKDK